MFNYVLKSFCGLSLFCMLISCGENKKDKYIASLDSFIIETNENYKDFSDEDWVKADETFMKLRNDEYPKYKHELTQDESKKVNELIGKYAALRVKDGILDFKSNVNDLMEQANSFVNEIKADSTLLKIEK